MQAPPTPPIHVPIVSNPPSFQPNGILTPEEFENLKRQIQLLRIAQLRYIVQKYDLPANGNKTRLVQLVLNLFDVMRNTPLLSTINQDVLNIVSSFHEPFTNPLENTHKLNLQKPESLQNISFVLQEHPFISYPVDVNESGIITPSPPLLGPIYALPGISSGKFTFSIEKLLHGANGNNNSNDDKSNDSNNEHKDENNGDENNKNSNQEQNKSPTNLDFRICLNYAWPNNEIVPFDMVVCINQIQLKISSQDPYPLPIDITDCCKLTSQPNAPISPNVLVDFQSVQTQTAMSFSITQYKLNKLNSIAASIYKVDEASLVPQAPLKEPLQLDRPPQAWVEDIAKQSYQPK